MTENRLCTTPAELHCKLEGLNAERNIFIENSEILITTLMIVGDVNFLNCKQNRNKLGQDINIRVKVLPGLTLFAPYICYKVI